MVSSTSADSPPVDVVDVSIQVGSFENSVADILELKSLPIPGAKTFLSGLDILGQLGDMAKVMNVLPGQPVSYALTEMGVGQTTIISAVEALEEINGGNNITSIILVGASAVVNPLVLPDLAAGIVLSKAGNLFDKLTVSGCPGSISRLKAGPLTFYSCAMRPNPWDDLANAPIIKVSAAGSRLMEFISKDIAGLALTAIPDQNGNADVPVNLGRWDLQVQGPSIDPAIVRGVNITAEGGPIYVSTVPVNQGAFDGRWLGSFSGMYTYPDPSTRTNMYDTLENIYLVIKGPIISRPPYGPDGTVDGSGNGTWTLREFFQCQAIYTVPSAIYAFAGTFTSTGTASGTWTFTRTLPSPVDDTAYCYGGVCPITGNGIWSATRK
jgi:hypothetical protein